MLFKRFLFQFFNPATKRGSFHNDCLNVQSIAPWVVYLACSRHSSCHGRHFDGAEKLLGKNKICYLQFLEPLFCCQYINKLQSWNNTVLLPT